MTAEIRKFVVDFAEQKKDGIVASDDLISYLQAVMKVRNSKIFAAKELQFKDNTTSVEIECKENAVVKKNMKQYVRRFLRYKSLANYIKVMGDGSNKISLNYINPVEEDAEE
ncbi:RL22 [Enterospora canceri]|uniref:RL22 n=1 Tax=Enterospora canceri TaxID=1081671 RepID=A0A1Y1S7I8_9MICR|nr:RL22 [Enterospora canceri]